jgi:hypothetical protein
MKKLKRTNPLNKKLTVISTFLIIMLVLTVISHAEDPVFDYADKSNYQDTDFYSNSDPSQWDWKNVDWEKIDYSNSDLYSNDDFYKKLPWDAYVNLDYNEVDYDHKNLDHDAIDSDKYLADKGCVSCQIDFHEKTKSSYSETGITHGNGDSVTIPGVYPTGTKFTVEKDQIRINFPTRSTELEIPEGDDVTLMIAPETYAANADGSFSFDKEPREVIIDQNTISGVIQFKDGQMIIKKDDFSTKINGVQVYSRSSDVNVYFDGEEHLGSYISMDQESGTLLAANAGVLKFQEENPFLTFEENDRLEFDVKNSASIQISQRENDLIPIVKMFGNGDVRNGKSNVYVEESKIKTYGFGSSGSVPFTLQLYDQEENNLLGTDSSPHQIIFDNSDQTYTLPSNSPSEIFECVECTENLATNKVVFDMASTRIRESTKIESIESVDAVSLYIFSQELDQLPTAVKNSVNGVIIVSEKDIGASCGSPNAVGCALGGVITLSADVDPNTLYHEAVHTYVGTFNDESNGQENLMKLGVLGLELKNKYDLQEKYGDEWTTFMFNEEVTELTDEEKEEFAGIRDKIIHGENTFIDEWEEIAGDIYGEGISSTSNVLWDDDSDGPKNGCTRAYGCTKVGEDIATFVEPIADKDYDFFAPLINPDSKQYDPRYEQKINLLWEHGFITTEDHKKIVGAP